MARDLKKMPFVKLEVHFLGFYEHGTCAYKHMKTCKEQGKLGYVSGGFGVVLAWFVADFGQGTGVAIGENVPRGTYSFC